MALEMRMPLSAAEPARRLQVRRRGGLSSGEGACRDSLEAAWMEHRRVGGEQGERLGCDHDDDDDSDRRGTR